MGLRHQRFIKVLSSRPSERDTGRGTTETIYRDEIVTLDLCEIEMIVTPKIGFGFSKLMMKSGRDVLIGQEDFDRIEAALLTREYQDA